MSVEISSIMNFFFQNCVSTGFYNNNYNLFAQSAKLGNFGNSKESMKIIDYKKKLFACILPLT